MEDNAGGPDDQLHMVIDFGTTKVAVSCQNIQPGESLRTGCSKILRLQGDLQEVPQVVGLHIHTEELRWGEEVYEWLSSEEVRQEDILQFRRLKICFSNPEEASKVNEALKTQLTDKNKASRDVFWLICRQLKRISKDIEAALRITYPHHSEEWFDNVTRHTQLAVPEISKLASMRKLQELTQRAGFKEVAVVSETELAAAWHLHKYALSGEKLPVKLEAGWGVFAADAGAALGSEQVLTMRCISAVKEAIKYKDGSFVGGKGVQIEMHENALDDMIRNSFELFKGTRVEKSRFIDLEGAGMGVEISRYCDDHLQMLPSD
ncbi:hypothetical protein LTR56_019297 [Elasticomyces elasticus]|nr:hypothetical protein LTR56_019297 [Elasticomyces elasticus]KAK3635310.1 hypothetical protein LTR22_019238 [Elasticomyces elasticus]KAK4931645.1 hypothetical protein LTR49_002037 [Elasticomyces elasticus]KAK5749473.1 hypothetical protein LTS12_020466 [Elasticomyces elasticus]